VIRDYSLINCAILLLMYWCIKGKVHIWLALMAACYRPKIEQYVA